MELRVQIHTTYIIGFVSGSGGSAQYCERDGVEYHFRKPCPLAWRPSLLASMKLGLTTICIKLKFNGQRVNPFSWPSYRNQECMAPSLRLGCLEWTWKKISRQGKMCWFYWSRIITQTVMCKDKGCSDIYTTTADRVIVRCNSLAEVNDKKQIDTLFVWRRSMCPSQKMISHRIFQRREQELRGMWLEAFWVSALDLTGLIGYGIYECLLEDGCGSLGLVDWVAGIIPAWYSWRYGTVSRHSTDTHM